MSTISEENPFIYGMSKQFVNALQELFIIMDSMGTGCVRYTDIANQWVEDDSDPYFPKGLINCLSKVTLPNGLLTFDRFCAGIKLCLLKNQVEVIHNNNDDNNNGMQSYPCPTPVISAPLALLPPTCDPMICPTPVPSLPSVPPPVPPHQSPPALIASKTLSQPSFNLVSKTTTSVPIPEVNAHKKPTASVSPVPPLPLHKVIPNTDYNSSDSSSTTLNANYERAKSMPQLMVKNNNNNNSEIRHYESDAKLAVRESNGNHKANRHIKSPTQSAKALSRSCIMKTLQNWRDNVLGRQALEFERINSKENALQIDNENYIQRNRFHHQLVPIVAQPPIFQQNGPAMRRTANKRREPRRHTVGSNGIDFYSIRRIQQLEQERNLFLQGLDAIDRARDWYLRQIAIIQEKMVYVSKVGTYPADYTLDAYQERINFQAARILNVNQHLSALFDSERGFPIHMNLAIRPINTQINSIKNDPNKPQFVVNPNVVNRLKEQNRLLTDEVSKKCERITQLEREKSALIRELFQARTQTNTKIKTETDDTTFM